MISQSEHLRNTYNQRTGRNEPAGPGRTVKYWTKRLRGLGNAATQNQQAQAAPAAPQVPAPANNQAVQFQGPSQYHIVQQPAVQAHNSTFLGLPAVVRTMIYREYLKVQLPGTLRPHGQWPLLRTCRQIRQEATQILHNESILRFAIGTRARFDANNQLSIIPTVNLGQARFNDMTLPAAVNNHRHSHWLPDFPFYDRIVRRIPCDALALVRNLEVSVTLDVNIGAQGTINTPDDRFSCVNHILYALADTIGASANLRRIDLGVNIRTSGGSNGTPLNLTDDQIAEIVYPIRRLTSCPSFPTLNLVGPRLQGIETLLKKYLGARVVINPKRLVSTVHTLSTRAVELCKLLDLAGRTDIALGGFRLACETLISKLNPPRYHVDSKEDKTLSEQVSQLEAFYEDHRSHFEALEVKAENYQLWRESSKCRVSRWTLD